MTLSRLLAALLATVALTAATAGSAHAVTVSAQAELRYPKTFPAALAGGFKQGERIPRGWVLLRRTASITREEGRHNVRFRCPGNRRVWTIGMNDPSELGLGVDNEMRNYRRRKAVRLFIYASTLVERGEAARGQIYVLCRPR
jgi:hypothetical protein